MIFKQNKTICPPPSLTFIISRTVVDLGLELIILVASHLPGGLEDEIVFLYLGRPGWDWARPNMDSLQFWGSVVDGRVHQRMAVVNWFPGFIDIFYFRFREHVVSKL